MRKYFTGSLIFTAVGLVVGAYAGWHSTETVSGALSALFIVLVLSVLEVSLSFDNAVVNATVLKDMDAIWRRRFLTWGIAIAVFGMRVVFPIVIVAVIAKLSPWAATVLAFTDAKEYARLLTEAHISVAAFGGAFLALVGLKHFIDEEKDIHWIAMIERPLARLGRVDSMQIGLVLTLLYVVSTQIEAARQSEFLIAGILGLVTFIAVDGVAALMEVPAGEATGAVARSGLASFLYLEVLDASFSFDGVIGAFALTTNLTIIAVGLGIGAMFVRSMTIMLVDENTLTEYRYLEHGAFYAIISLGVIMFMTAFVHIPEVITGLIGAGFIALSLWSSVAHNRAHRGGGGH